MKDFLLGSEQTAKSFIPLPSVIRKNDRNAKGDETRIRNEDLKKSYREQDKESVRIGACQKRSASPKADCSFYINGFQLRDCLQCFR